MQVLCILKIYLIFISAFSKENNFFDINSEDEILKNSIVIKNGEKTFNSSEKKDNA